MLKNRTVREGSLRLYSRGSCQPPPLVRHQAREATSGSSLAKHPQNDTLLSAYHQVTTEPPQLAFPKAPRTVDAGPFEEGWPKTLVPFSLGDSH